MQAEDDDDVDLKSFIEEGQHSTAVLRHFKEYKFTSKESASEFIVLSTIQIVFKDMHMEMLYKELESTVEVKFDNAPDFDFEIQKTIEILELIYTKVIGR